MTPAGIGAQRELEELAARLVRAQEAIADGEYELALAVMQDLEDDVARRLAHYRAEAA